MQLSRQIAHLQFSRILTFLISSAIYLTYFLAYADPGNDVNSTNDLQIQNPTISQMPDVTNFSNVKCISGLNHVLLSGQFHNENIAYKVIFLKMLIFDKPGSLISTGNGYVSDIKPHEIKEFNAISRFAGNFSSCSIQVDNAIPK